MKMVCKYERWRTLPAGRELDEIVQREACTYPAYKVAPKWSTNPALIPTLVSHLAESTISSLTIELEPVEIEEKNSVGRPLIERAWRVTHSFPGMTKGEGFLIEAEPYEQDGEGKTLNLALCRALLHMACDCSGGECA